MGVSSQVWTQSVTAGFETGKKNNTSLTPHGISLSPEVVKIEGITEPYVWALAKDQQGQVYVGTGDPGSVYLLTLQNKLQSLFRSTELHVHTLTVSPTGEIYAGSSPEGHIYRISPNGEAKLFCDLPAKYIWKLILDGRGNLYAATGTEGIIYKIPVEGNPPKAEVFFDSSETHLLDLVMDKESNLYTCSEPNGLIYKINPQGQAFVIYDAEEGEVHCLAMDSLGQLYAGTASGARPRIPIGPPTPAIPPAPKPPSPTEPAPSPVSSETFQQEPSLPPPIPERLRPKEAEKPKIPTTLPKITNFIYRIALNGTVKKVLEIPQALALCMTVDSSANILVGTGSEARIYKIDTKGESCTLLDVEEAQVLSLLDMGERGFFFSTGNPGRVLLASNNYCQEGSFESEVFDARFPTAWGNLTWEVEAPEGARVSLSTRTGNSRKPDNTWSSWSEEYFQEGKIRSPSSRFIQYRARFITSIPQETPLLGRVSIAYLPQNQAPDILSLSVSQRERFPRYATTGKGQEPGAAEEAPRTPPSVLRPGVGSRETKYINWKATDPNGDLMRYQLFYKGFKEKEWKPITREEIKGDSFLWQTTRVPDGEYLVKLVVSDEPENPQGIALSAEKVSDPFLIDNTRPLLVNLKAIVNPESKAVEVSGQARDELSIINRLEYSVDAGDWRAIFPRDNIFDSREEDFQFIVEGLPPGEQTIVINATDTEGNIGSGNIVLELSK
ncbi:MAG TPA: hypothetical protein ACFYD3_07890 [Candidatus Hypogeohydataceae bacterium YC41]